MNVELSRGHQIFKAGLMSQGDFGIQNGEHARLARRVIFKYKLVSGSQPFPKMISVSNLSDLKRYDFWSIVYCKVLAKVW